MVRKPTKVVYHIRSVYSNGSGNSSSMLSYTQTLESYRQRIRKVSSANIHLAKQLSVEKEKNRQHGQTGQRYSQISTLHLPRIKAWLEENSAYIKKLEANHARALELMNRILNPSAKLGLTVYLEAEGNEDGPRRQLKPPGTSGHKYFTMPGIPETREEEEADGAGSRRSSDFDFVSRRSTANVTERKKRLSEKGGKKQSSGTPTQLPISNTEQEAALPHGTSKGAPVEVTKRSTGNGAFKLGAGTQLPVGARQQATQRRVSGPSEGRERRRGSNAYAVPPQPDGKVPITGCPTAKNAPLQESASQPTLVADHQARPRPQTAVRAMPSHLRAYVEPVKPGISVSKFLQSHLTHNTEKGGSEIRVDGEKDAHKDITQDQNHATGATDLPAPSTVGAVRSTAAPALHRGLPGMQGTVPEMECVASAHVEDSHTLQPPNVGCARTSCKFCLTGKAVGTSTDGQTAKPKPAPHNEIPSKRGSQRPSQRRSSLFHSTNVDSRRDQSLDAVGSSEMRKTDKGRWQETVDVLPAITNTSSPRRRGPDVRFSSDGLIASPSSGQKKKAPDLPTNEHARSSAETTKAQHGKENEQPRTSYDGVGEPLGQQQRPKRAARRLSYKEPCLNTKLRRP